MMSYGLKKFAVYATVGFFWISLISESFSESRLYPSKKCTFSKLPQKKSQKPRSTNINSFRAVNGFNKFQYIQTQIGTDWYNNSPEDIDPINNLPVEGSEVDKLYQKLPSEHLEDIIVAVIDSGMDISHKDLKDNIWINKKEIPNNCIDDDQNGYIDDINGWNYLQKSNGEQISSETLEVTRELYRLKKLGQTQSEYYKKIRKAYTKGLSGRKNSLNSFNKILESIQTAITIFAGDIEEYSKREIIAIKTGSKIEASAKETLLDLFEKYKSKNFPNVRMLKKYIVGAVSYYKGAINFHYNLKLAENPQRSDDPNFFGSIKNTPEKLYGDNNIFPADANESHATHVAGIIGAIRNNKIGINGVAANVKIMALRVVPDGDESDKDVYHSVYYAVDNGARVINMSFGKDFSRNSNKVLEAFEYAASKGVLIVHSAGNGYSNNDSTVSYPERKLLDPQSDTYKNWLEIGASTSVKGKSLKASFSNYGKKTVDLFAPGYKIKSSVNNNKYAYYSGTSMASPVVAGTIAVMLSYDGTQNTSLLKKKILETSRTYPDLFVDVPSSSGTTKAILFKNLSISGGVLNSLKLFEKIE